MSKASQEQLDLINTQVKRFGRDIQRAAKRAKVPDLFVNRLDDAAREQNEIRFLRRWNSHTPIVAGDYGGGYFLRWQQRGTVIDPGCSFLHAFSRYSEYSFHDIDMVIATHDHVDHCQDLGTLVSLLRQFNQEQVRTMEPLHTWDMVVSHGVYDMYQSILLHPENRLFLNLRVPLPPGQIRQMWELPTHLKEVLANGRNGRTLQMHQVARLRYHNQREIRKSYHYDLECTRTHHKELLGDRTGFGVKFALHKPGKSKTCCVIGCSSDTAIKDGKYGLSVDELVNAWKEDVNLLVLHVGTMETAITNAQTERLSQHLGFQGVCDVLSALKESKVQMVVLAEWGYECGGYGRRTRFCELVEDALAHDTDHKYYSITRETPRENSVPIVPCDLGLRVSLPEIELCSQSSGAEEFLPHHKVRAIERGERFDYEPR